MSLIEKLSQLSNPQPVFIDPEDNTDESSARLTEKGEDEETISVGHTQLRRRATEVDDDDVRYKGKPVSRKAVLEEESVGSDDLDGDIDADSESGDLEENGMESEEVSEEPQEEEVDQTGSDVSDDDLEAFKQQVKKQAQPKQEFVFEDDGDYGKYGDDSEGSDFTDSDGESEDAGSDITEEEEGPSQNFGNDSADFGDGGVQSFSHVDLKEEIKKGEAAKAQIALWDNLLEYRIRLQKLLVSANQLPQPTNWEQFTSQAGEEYQTALKQGEEALKQLLDQLSQLQSLLLFQYPATKSVATAHLTQSGDKSANKSSIKQGTTADSDEEILSDEGEMSDKQEEEEEEMRMKLKRKIKMADYPGFLAKRHSMFQPFRDDTIQKWYDKTRVASGKLGKGFSAFESSALKQIEQILSDKNRLIKRTQLKRSTYRVLGQDLSADTVNEEGTQSMEENQLEESSIAKKDSLKDYDEEIFDDDDFYHQLLRQLIERKTVDVNDPIALSRQWLEIQKLRSKVKKTVDTKASKGRKLRFDVHTKLVNFMAPFDTCKWTDQARDDLFKSVFGGKPSVS